MDMGIYIPGNVFNFYSGLNPVITGEKQTIMSDTRFKKGDERINRAGRPPGSTERVKQLRERISQLIDQNYTLDLIRADLQALKPAERLTLLDKLLRHVLPPPAPENLLDGFSDDDLSRLIDYLKKEIN